MSCVAIIIGCHTYKSLSSLPASANDAAAVEAVLRATGRFDDLVLLAADTDATSVKGRLARFVSEHRDNDIDELVFYYSGHGIYRDGDFTYALTDFNPAKSRETGLQNSEVDSMLRALKPSLAVKIVDACNSGVPYVKGANLYTLEQHIKGSGDAFAKCYFLFSCARDQESYADDRLSEFTGVLLHTLRERPLGPVRYKDLISGVADFFDTDRNQRPLFVSQADHTELFCEMTTELQQFLARQLDSPQEPGDAEDLVLSRISAGASAFVDQDEAFEAVERLADHATSSALPEPLTKYFALEPVKSNAVSHEGAARIGQWLEDYGTDILAKPTYKLVAEAQTMIQRMQGVQPRHLESGDVDGYSHLVRTPISFVRLTASPKFPNLHQFALLLVPLLARDHVRLFWSTCEYHHRTWESIELVAEPTWTDEAIPWARARSPEVVHGPAQRLFRTLAEHVAVVAGLGKEERDRFLASLLGPG